MHGNAHFYQKDMLWIRKITRPNITKHNTTMKMNYIAVGFQRPHSDGLSQHAFALKICSWNHLQEDKPKTELFGDKSVKASTLNTNSAN